MATNVYLGYPPPKIRKWIEDHSGNPKTVITFYNGDTEEYLWTGTVSLQNLVDAEICDDACMYFKYPVSIQFGTTVTSIGTGAFQYCDSLTSVSMPNVTTINANAFYNCTSLTSVSMPNANTVDEGVFYGCTSLTSVSMPNVQTVGVEVFYSCTSLTSVSMPNVTSIDYGAFSDCPNLASVSMPNVTSIGESAFKNCTSLASVSMPSVTTVYAYAFAYISQLVEFKNQTTSQISDWFGGYVFGDGWGVPVEVTCSNGSVYAEWDGTGWTITVTS